MTTPSTPTGEALIARLEAVEKRERQLAACADLYAEIYDFMDALTSRTFVAYDAVRDDTVECDVLRLKHITAMAIRDDYRRTSRENREDVALMAALRSAATGAAQ